MNILLIGLPFFKSITQGWITYYKNSSGPRFTEEQIRMSDSAANTLLECSPVDSFLNGPVHLEVCRSLTGQKFMEATQRLEQCPPELDLKKAACLEALKIGVWLLGTCSPESIRGATYILLACEHYFPTI